MSKRKQRLKQKRLDQEWIQSRHKPLTLDEAAAKLQDDGFYKKAAKGVPLKELMSGE